MVKSQIELTLHDGRVLVIHESAWSKFFDVKLGVKKKLEPGDMSHGRLEFSFSLPKKAKQGGEDLTPAKGAMILQETRGRLSLR